MIELWDLRSLDHESPLLGHEESVTSLAWSPDGKILASTCLEQVRLWDLASAGNWESSTMRLSVT